MKHTTTILAEIRKFMEQNGLTLLQLSQKAEINTGSLSSILNGKRLLNATHLDSITAALALPEGYFYEQYIEEFLAQTAPDWRRARPFLDHCAKLDKLDCIRQVTGILLDNLMYLPLLFEAAEDLFDRGLKEAAAILYENVAMSERMQHSERLAMCQYRLFLLRQSEDQEKNYQAALQFEPFVDRLDEFDQLDALKDLGNTYRSLYRWDKVEEIAHSMEHRAKLQYTRNLRLKKKEHSQKKPSRPLFSYIALSNLFLADICNARGDYEQALKYTYAYADLSWVKETDMDTLHWKGLFQKWAEANLYVNKLLSGDIDILPDYIAYVETKEEEILPALVNILRAANQYNINVDDILLRFDSYITTSTEELRAAGIYTDQFMSNSLAFLLYELAKYQLNKSRYKEVFDALQISLEKSVIINNKTCLIRCAGLLELLCRLGYSFADEQAAKKECSLT
ncbi:helix-turn-helix transcriptional regulator [Paenibacillus macerans]|uniref:helix-turn-helix domain-containing protein n=1 Tax=Paenibacillus macerans TaxID=44252 RepID=UPI00203C075D|nr:helix-turn-helix transcriptional regulator [Paenibacillus macerans]MCM3699275.1 helix-turn-helix domain-containing protein [Paenibacillus macerans]